MGSATFKFEIPLATDSAGPGAVEPVNDSEGSPAGRRLRILLAEDHVVNRLTVELILENLPVEIVAVENGAEAVEAYRSGDFDLILMDMQMPVMDGLAAIRLIRDLEVETGRRRAPICILSANAMIDHREAGAAAGADDFMTKPISAQGLISYVLETSRDGKTAAQVSSNG